MCCFVSADSLRGCRCQLLCFQRWGLEADVAVLGMRMPGRSGWCWGWLGSVDFGCYFFWLWCSWRCCRGPGSLGWRCLSRHLGSGCELLGALWWTSRLWQPSLPCRAWRSRSVLSPVWESCSVRRVDQLLVEQRGGCHSARWSHYFAGRAPNYAYCKWAVSCLVDLLLNPRPCLLSLPPFSALSSGLQA